MNTTNHPHDYTRGDLCGCAACRASHTAAIEVSRAQASRQAAQWHPRSRRLATIAAADQVTADQAVLAARRAD
jgi:hypothetical protein